MKLKKKIELARELAKEYWNKSDSSLRYNMLRSYIIYLNNVDYFDVHLSHTQYENMSKMDWRELAFIECGVQTSELRDSVSYYLGIGLYEGYQSNDVQAQREYSLKVLNVN
jgi:hypothetical protein